MDQEAARAFDLAIVLVIGVTALPAGLEAARADGSSVAAARFADHLFAAWPRTPL